MPTTLVDLGFHPRGRQADVFRNFLRFVVLVVHRRGGKTLLAIMKLIDAALRCEREAGRFAYIAPQLKQAKGIAWEYLKSYSRKIPGTIINESELYVRFPNGAQIRLFGADNPDSLRGFYFDGVVLDEVAQMPLNIWGEILLPALADRLGWALFIGTPHGINLFSQIYYAALRNAEWFAKLYTYEATHALDDEEVERMKRDMTPNQFRQEMLCDFMASDDDTLISQDVARAAATRTLDFATYSFAPKVLGVDVAWTGGDRSVIFRKQGLNSWEPKVYPGIPEKTFAANIMRLHDEWKPDACFVDITGGYGGEVVSRLQDGGYNVQGVKFSWKASEDKFLNLRAEMWFKLAAWLGEGARIANNETLIAELCSPKYSNDNASNRLQLESKDDVKKRLGFSPDMADAAALCFAFPVFSDQQTIEVREQAARMGIVRGDSSGGGFSRADYNPFKRR